MLRWIGNIFFAIVIALSACWVTAILTANNSSLGPAALLLILVFGSGMLVTSFIWFMGLTRRSRWHLQKRTTIILTYLEQTVRLNLPISRMLLAAEASEPHWIALSISNLRERLEACSSMADALRSVPGVQRRMLALIDAAERAGQVGPELHRVLDQHQSRHHRDGAQRSFMRAYPVAMFIVITIVLTLLMVFVMPRFMQIFKDFRTPMPPLTVAVIRFTNVTGDFGWLIIGIILTVIAATLQFAFRPGEGGKFPRPFTTNRDLSDVCHILALSIEAGQPLPLAIRNASELSIGRPLRKQLKSWAVQLDQGTPTAQAAHFAQLPKLIAGITPSTDGFQFLSRYYASKFSRFTVLLRASAIPAMVFFFGVIVAIVALALFLPMVSLINISGPYPNSPL